MHTIKWNHHSHGLLKQAGRYNRVRFLRWPADISIQIKGDEPFWSQPSTTGEHEPWQFKSTYV